MFLLIQLHYTYSPLCPLICSIPLLRGKKFKQIFIRQNEQRLSESQATQSVSSIFSLSHIASSIYIPRIQSFYYSSYSMILKITKGNVASKISASLHSFIQHPPHSPLMSPNFKCKKRLLHWVGVWAWWHFKCLPTLKI